MGVREYRFRLVFFLCVSARIDSIFTQSPLVLSIIDNSLRKAFTSPTYIQQSSIPRKPRVSIPTSKHLQKNASNKPNSFYELPTGVNSDSLDWKLNGLGSQAILEVPKEIVSFFPENDELYTTQYEGNSGVWYAVLFALDPEFITRTMGNQEKCVKEVKQQMCIELDDYYHKYRYRQYGYAKSNMNLKCLLKIIKYGV